jgi:hypothetical protein
LTVSSLRHLPVSRTGATHGVHPAELFPLAELYASRRLCPLAVSDIAFFCSEDQKITMPRGFRAFLPARIRFPFPGPKTRWDRCSPGLFAPLQSGSLHTAEPASRLLPSCAL